MLSSGLLSSPPATVRFMLPKLPQDYACPKVKLHLSSVTNAVRGRKAEVSSMTDTHHGLWIIFRKSYLAKFCSTEQRLNSRNWKAEHDSKDWGETRLRASEETQTDIYF